MSQDGGTVVPDTSDVCGSSSRSAGISDRLLALQYQADWHNWRCHVAQTAATEPWVLCVSRLTSQIEN